MSEIARRDVLGRDVLGGLLCGAAFAQPAVPFAWKLELIPNGSRDPDVWSGRASQEAFGC
jgi:hypothetical protein